MVGVVFRVVFFQGSVFRCEGVVYISGLSTCVSFIGLCVGGGGGMGRGMVVVIFRVVFFLVYVFCDGCDRSSTYMICPRIQAGYIHVFL